MAKTTSIVLGLTFLALSVLGITGFVPMFASDPSYVNIDKIVLGGLGLLMGIYSRQSNKVSQQTKDLSRQSKDNADLRDQEIERLKKQLELQKKKDDDRQQQETQRMQKLIERQHQENERLRKHNQ
jgi:hypothetical protein